MGATVCWRLVPVAACPGCHPLTAACLHPQAGGTRGDCLVSVGLDLMATCCDYAGVPKPKHCLGLSLRSVAEATNPKATVPRTYVYCENQVSYCVADASWKYVLYDHVRVSLPRSFLPLQKSPASLMYGVSCVVIRPGGGQRAAV